MYILKIAYDGRYSFQQQPHKQTVCDILLDALEETGFLAKRRLYTAEEGQIKASLP